MTNIFGEKKTPAENLLTFLDTPSCLPSNTQLRHMNLICPVVTFHAGLLWLEATGWTNGLLPYLQCAPFFIILVCIVP